MKKVALLFAVHCLLHPAVIATSKPAQALTPARIMALPKTEQKPWLDYLQRSDEQRLADKAALAAERQGLANVPPAPREGFAARAMPLTREPDFYATPQALGTAVTAISYQLPSGGWSKNLAMDAPRQKGQSWMADNVSKFLGPDDFDQPADPAWNYAGTLDNDATNTELQFLARVQAAHPGAEGEPLRRSFLAGIAYLLHAQYPNGGWPQVWPLEGGYHDAVTFNDNAVTESAQTLMDCEEARGNFAFVPAATRRAAASAAARAITLILRAQVVVAGKRTVWAQQQDPLTLVPVAGRNFEPAALSAGESSDVLLFLMGLPHPSPAIEQAIADGIAWLKANAIYGEAWVGGRVPRAPGTPPPATPPTPRHLEARPGAGPLWPRYTSLTTGKPVFGDRDKTIHDNVEDLSIERRNGYAWYSPGPKAALDAYDNYHPKG